jgi:cation:H+ antiporter
VGCAERQHEPPPSGQGDAHTYVAAGLTLVLEGALVVGLLALVVMGTQLPRDVSLLRMSPASIVITLVWLVGLYLLKRARGGPAVARGR